MNCPCDQFDFPPPLYIPAGLPRLSRQIAGFAEFRRALLHDISAHPALQTWRGRQRDDFGIMLAEMWAYLCDSIAFYDQVGADESYVRTALRRESLRRLVALLGYRPRPAVGATVNLAAFADGRRAVVLPAGTAFRSDAFDGNPPQVFELTADTLIHPLSNEWNLLRRRPFTFGPTPQSVGFLLCEVGSVTAKKGDLILVRVGAQAFPRTVQNVSAHDGADGARYTQVDFGPPFTIPSNTPVGSVTLSRPTLTAGLWPQDYDGVGAFSVTPLFTAPFTPLPPSFADLDAVYRSARAGQDVMFEVKGTLAARRILGTSLLTRVATPASSTTFKDAANNDVTVPIPASSATVTRLVLDADLVSAGIYALGAKNPFLAANSSDIAVHLGFIPAGTVTIEALTTLAPSDLLQTPTPLEVPPDAPPPGRWQLEDKNGVGTQIDGTLNYTSGVLGLGQGATWDPPLAVPVRLFGNIVTATRGESVQDELLGYGAAAQANQTFKLKKGPLTYLPAPTQGNDSGVANTLKVYVDGILWTEVPSFFGVAPTAHVYIVRQNDQGESFVTFGNGVRAARLATGARVSAWYRFGAGAATPPAGGIHQLSRPVKGLTKVRNPVAAVWGADAESAELLRSNAPRSALLLGRAVSLADLEAATALTEGVRAARAEWRWNLQRQSPAAQIFYVGDPVLGALITQRLRGLTEPSTPLGVTPAVGLPSVLAIQITIDPNHLEADVLAQVRAALMDPLSGLLAPERVGIGTALFRSRIYEFVCSVPGALAVADLQFNKAPFADWGITPGAGHFFDFEKGALFLNGKSH